MSYADSVVVCLWTLVTQLQDDVLQSQSADLFVHCIPCERVEFFR